MKKILVGFIVDGHGGGIDRYLLNFLQKVSGDDASVDFLTNEVNRELKEELHNYHAGLYAIKNLKHPIAQYRQVKALILAKKYDMVYLNISTAIDCIAAKAAYDCKVPRRLIHSHSSGNDIANPIKRGGYDTVHRICKMRLYRWGNEFYGCSKAAGYWLFPKKIVNSQQFHMIYNGVDQERFCFNPLVRKDMRERMGIAEKLVIGNISGFVYQKNHDYLLDIFSEIHKREENAVLLLIGQGEGMESMKVKAKTLGIKKDVLFLGWRKDTAQLLQAMDVFLLPSRFEGLPIAGIEAQASGLLCVMSDSITQEAKISEACYFLPARGAKKQWADFVIRHKNYNREETVFLEESKRYSQDYQNRQFEEIVNG
ncbi:MAG: glycosyltransferase [Hespellia sp.]|nr:glycosyltransferase [Hespellia sp.]